MSSVFLSYGHPDRDRAKVVAEALVRAGHEVWWDRQIKGGAQFSKEIELALDRADVIVVLWSANSVESTWVRDEAAVGRDSGRLVPVRIDTTQPPLGFRQFHTIDLLAPRLNSRSEETRALIAAVGTLVGDRETAAPTPSLGWNAEDRTPTPQVRFSRRSVTVAALAGAGVLTVGAVAYRFFETGNADEPSPEVAAILAQAWQSWTQGTAEGNNQAIGLYRRATEIAPNFADAWGFLGCAYADKAHNAPNEERTGLRTRAKEAGSRALDLDRSNAYGRLALAYARPIRGNWLLMEREFTKVADEFPDKWLATYSLGLHLMRVGRNRDAASRFEKIRNNAPTVYQYMLHAQALWAAGQPDQAERLLNEAAGIFSTHPAIRFARFQMLLFGGDASAALAMIESQADNSAPQNDLSQPQWVARAAVTRDAAQIEPVMAALLRTAHQSADEAGSAIGYACLFGRIDDAFGIARALFLSDGYAIPDDRSRPDVALESRYTTLLFFPSTQALRADRRFETLVDEIGLTRYWREAGSTPDYKA